MQKAHHNRNQQRILHKNEYKIEISGCGRNERQSAYICLVSNFLVSARKYRPDHFSSVVGQQHVTKTLLTAIKNDQVAQAFLFCGPRGVGKTSCARILAKTLNCTNRRPDFEACDVCESCVSFRSGTSFNIHELDAASNNTVEDIRGLVEQVRYAPQAGRYKIYIIDEVHMLSTNAFNAFLKTLEEPPSYAIFILATTEKHKIIPTILSRCQIFDFHRISMRDMAVHLEHIAREEGIAFETEAIHMIAQKADGALRDALSSFDQLSIFTDNNITYRSVIENLNILDYEYYFRVTDQILAEDIAGTLILFDDILRNGFNGNNFLNGLSGHFRELLVAKDEQTLFLLEVSDQAKVKYAAQSRLCSQSFLLSAMAIGSQAEINYRTSKNQRLQVELALMKMCHILSAFRVKAQVPVRAEQPGKHLPEVRLVAEPEVRVVSEPEKKNFGLIPDPTTGSSTPVITAPAVQLVPAQVPEEMSAVKLSVQAERIATSSIKIRLPKAGEIHRQSWQEEEADVATIVEEEKRELTLPEVWRAWEQYASTINDGSKANLHHLLAANKPKLEHGNVIVALVENTIQRVMLQDELSDLQAFLKDHLDNRSVRIRIEVMEPAPDKKKILFTAHDRFLYMAEKNPFLLEFKNRLDLDLER